MDGPSAASPRFRVRVRGGMPPRHSVRTHWAFRTRSPFRLRNPGRPAWPGAAADVADDVGGGAHRLRPAQAALGPGLRRERPTPGPADHFRRPRYRRPAIVAPPRRAPVRGGAGDDGGDASALRHWQARLPPHRPALAPPRFGLHPQPARPANLRSVGAGGDAACGEADGVRPLAMTGSADRFRSRRRRRLHSAVRSLHLPSERLADRRKNAASGRVLAQRWDFLGRYHDQPGVAMSTAQDQNWSQRCKAEPSIRA